MFAGAGGCGCKGFSDEYPHRSWTIEFNAYWILKTEKYIKKGKNSIHIETEDHALLLGGKKLQKSLISIKMLYI